MPTDQSSVEPLDPETLARLPDFHHPAVSSDGTIAVQYDVTGRNELHLVDPETGEHERLTDGELPRSARWPVEWSGDGERVLFHRDNGGDEQNDVWAVDRDGSVETLIEVDGQASIQDSTPDGRVVLYASDEGDQLNLYQHDRETGEQTQLTHHDRPARGALYDPDGDRVAYVTNESDNRENRDVYVTDADGGEPRRLDAGTDGTELTVEDWGPDGDRLLLHDNSEDLGRLGVYDLRTDEVDWLGNGEYEEREGVISPNGDCIVALRTRHAATIPVVYERPSGVSQELDLPDGVADLASGDPFLDGDELVFSHTSPADRKSLLRYDLTTDDAETLLAPAYDEIDPDVFVDAEYVSYESEDGTSIGALLYDPRDGSGRSASETEMPAVVKVHGGPHSQSTQRFDRSVQFLVSKGYAVLQPNYRGSIGRGREFKNAIHGDWGGMEQVDVRRGAEWLAERDWIDDDRIAVSGASYGGYSAYCQMTMHPEPWAAGVAKVGITDLRQLYENSMPHFQAVLERNMGDPVENESLWRERSPIEHVGNVTDPIFVVHGINDPRCPIEQARAFRDAMEANGLAEGEEYEYEELGEEGHGSTDQEQQLRSLRLLGNFLDQRL